MGRPTKAKAIERLRKILNELPELKSRSRDSHEFIKWRRDSEIAIGHTFGKDSEYVKEFRTCLLSRIARTEWTQEQEFHKDYMRCLDSAASVLESMIDEIEEYWEEDEKSPDTFRTEVKSPKDTNKVFVVHGRDESAKQTVARFLEKLDLEPVILHEQASKGRTIIEKFEDHSDVGFAVVLLTPDDVGALKDSPDDLKSRARQNVILELGFFLGKLGRQRVCPLVKGDMETPSDYDGVVYTKLDDAGAWKIKLVQELKVADFNVDANKVM